MAFDFEKLRRFGPAAFVVKAIVVAIVADLLLLGFILLRRGYRRRYFAKRDARVFEFRQCWDALISGEIPFETWRNKRFDRQIIETIVFDELDIADTQQSARLLRFLRASGLIENSIFEARKQRGWRRREALVILGRTRAPEAIPALTEGLRDDHQETRLAALRGLELIACPEAAKGILVWLNESGLTLPALPVQSALVQCCAETPQMLLPYLENAQKTVREVLGRVLGEIATPTLETDLLQFVDDELPELRAASARGLSHAKPNLALGLLSELSDDPIWFVRLRAIVSLGKLGTPEAMPWLLRGLSDSKRLVRLRAGEALLKLKLDVADIFEKVAATKDRYGIHAFLTALDNAGLTATLEAKLTSLLPSSNAGDLLELLHKGPLAAANIPPEKAAAKAASLP